MIKKDNFCIFFFIIIFFITSCSSAPKKPAEIVQGDYSFAIRYLDWIIGRTMKKDNINGVVVAVVDGEHTIYSQAYGYADVKAKIPMTIDTFFKVGSISKSLTALGVMKLVHQGKLDLDTPLQHYIPEFSVKNRFDRIPPLTARYLLSHKGGMIRDYYYGIMGSHIIGEDEILSAIAEEYLCFPPGSAFKYSNIGYTVLGILIERVSGISYEEYMEQEILEPLGMKKSSFLLTDEIKKCCAEGYVRESLVLIPKLGEKPKIVPARQLELRDKPAGGLYSSLPELIHFLHYLLSDKDRNPVSIVSDAEFNTMIEVNYPEAEDYSLLYFDYGLGFIIELFAYQHVNDIVGHNGWVNGFSTLYVFSLEHDMAMIILTNADTGNKACDEIVSTSFKYFLEACKGNPFESVKKETKKRQPWKPSTEQCDRYTGKYSMIGVSLDVYVRGKKLFCKTSIMDMEFLLVPVTPGVFKPVYSFLCFRIDIAGFAGYDTVFFRFITNSRGVSYLFIEASVGEYTTYLSLVKIKKEGIPPVFQSYCGIYEMIITEKTREVLDMYLPTKEYELTIDNGWLTIKSFNLSPEISLILLPVSENEAIIPGSGETVYFGDGFFSFSGFKARKRE